MLTHVEKNEPIHAEFVEKRTELRTTIRQLERSRALLKQSESAISFWTNVNQDGFGELLTSAERVESGGKSTIRRRTQGPNVRPRMVMRLIVNIWRRDVFPTVGGMGNRTSRSPSGCSV